MVTALHSHMLTESPRLFFHVFLAERRCGSTGACSPRRAGKNQLSQGAVARNDMPNDIGGSRVDVLPSVIDWARKPAHTRSYYQVKSNLPADAPKILAQGHER
jgi:hypothetical protein